MLKKILLFVLALTLMLPVCSSFAEGKQPTFSDLADLEWTFSSGVGAWMTWFTMDAEGHFSGSFHDSEMGETGDGYPNGTVYCSGFTGNMVMGETVNEHACKVTIKELKLDADVDTETIEDEIRYVTVTPYGLSEGDEMILYYPGTPVSELTEEQLFWTHVQDCGETVTALSDYFLSNVKTDSGFISQPAAQGMLNLDNPWEEVSAEELMNATGLSFDIPEGAKEIRYSMMRKENLAQMTFMIDSDEFCARMMPADLRNGELMDLSGMYFAWENEEKITVNHCEGIIHQAKTGSEDCVEACLWYDAAPGILYSLTVCTTDLDGLDLVAVAEQVFHPLQGEVDG